MLSTIAKGQTVDCDIIINSKGYFSTDDYEMVANNHAKISFAMHYSLSDNQFNIAVVTEFDSIDFDHLVIKGRDMLSLKLSDGATMLFMVSDVTDLSSTSKSTATFLVNPVTAANTWKDELRKYPIKEIGLQINGKAKYYQNFSNADFFVRSFACIDKVAASAQDPQKIIQDAKPMMDSALAMMANGPKSPCNIVENTKGEIGMRTNQEIIARYKSDSIGLEIKRKYSDYTLTLTYYPGKSSDFNTYYIKDGGSLIFFQDNLGPSFEITSVEDGKTQAGKFYKLTLIPQTPNWKELLKSDKLVDTIFVKGKDGYQLSIPMYFKDYFQLRLHCIE